jgi:hypothetical protein
VFQQRQVIEKGDRNKRKMVQEILTDISISVILEICENPSRRLIYKGNPFIPMITQFDAHFLFENYG